MSTALRWSRTGSDSGRFHEGVPCRANRKSWIAYAAPRVQITYDVETNGAMEKKELPFVVGVLADLSGQPSAPLPPLKERKAVNDRPRQLQRRPGPVRRRGLR